MQDGPAWYAVACFIDNGNRLSYKRLMATKARSIAVREFESKCLSLVEEVASTGETVILTKEGKPIAKVVPFKQSRPLLGSALWEGDIVSPTGETWDAES